MSCIAKDMSMQQIADLSGFEEIGFSFMESHASTSLATTPSSSPIARARRPQGCELHTGRSVARVPCVIHDDGVDYQADAFELDDLAVFGDLAHRTVLRDDAVIHVKLRARCQG